MKQINESQPLSSLNPTSATVSEFKKKSLPSASHCQTSKFPPSIQMRLFDYLDESQQEFLRPILGILKNPFQALLCCALLDYIEHDDLFPPKETILCGIFYYCVQHLSLQDSSHHQSLTTLLEQSSQSDTL